MASAMISGHVAASSAPVAVDLLRPEKTLQHPFGGASQGKLRACNGRDTAGRSRAVQPQGQLRPRISCAASSRSFRSAGKPCDDAASPPGVGQTLVKRLQATAAACAIAAALAVSPLTSSPAMAADTAQVGTCLLESCQGQLAGCLTDGNCIKNLVCLQKCNGREDESDCQIKCGDLYESKAIATFNECAVSSKKCVPQRIDNDLFPIPSEASRDHDFSIKNFTGRWYITAGLNPLFDTFPCQEHFFGNPEPGVLFGKINWRVPTGTKGDFLQRGVTQTFKQTKEDPAVLLNHNNAYLHYEDDWYILASKPNEYVLIYYIGNNDAWKGYGGATVYTREPKLPKKYIPELRAALDNASTTYTWDDFTITDNSCPAKPQAKNLFALLSEEFKEGQKDIEAAFTSFGKGFTLLENELVKDFGGEEEEIMRELNFAESYLERIEKQYETTLFDLPPFKWFVGKKEAAPEPAGAALQTGDVPGVASSPLS